MQRLLIDNRDGFGYRDFTRFLWEAGQFLRDTVNQPILFDFRIINVDNVPCWVLPKRGAVVRFEDTRFDISDEGHPGVLFTGVLTSDPEYVFLGSKNGQEAHGYACQATSEDFKLNIKQLTQKTYINRTRGYILADLITSMYDTPGEVMPFELSNILDGGVERIYTVDLSKKWTEVAAEFAKADGYVYSVLNSYVYYRPAMVEFNNPDPAATVRIESTDPRYNPHQLRLSRAGTEIYNDVTVLGQDEAGPSVTECFVSDGHQPYLQLTHMPYGVEEATLVDDDLAATTFDTSRWQVRDDGGHLEMFEDSLNVTGGPGGVERAALVLRKGLELGGILEFRDGEIMFGPTASGTAYLGTLYNSDELLDSSIVVGWKLLLTVGVDNPNGPAIVPVGPGGVLETAGLYYLNTSFSYILRKRMRADQVRRSSAAFLGATETGNLFEDPQTLQTDAEVYWTIDEIDTTDPEDLFTRKIEVLRKTYQNISDFALYSAVASVNARFAMNNVMVKQPTQVDVLLDNTGKTPTPSVVQTIDNYTGTSTTVWSEDWSRGDAASAFQNGYWERLIQPTRVVNHHGSGSYPGGYSATVHTLTLSNTVPSTATAGNLIVLCISRSEGSSGLTVTDSEGHTYTKQVSAGSATSGYIEIWTTTVVTGGTSLEWTVTSPVSEEVWISYQEISGWSSIGATASVVSDASPMVVDLPVQTDRSLMFSAAVYPDSGPSVITTPTGWSNLGGVGGASTQQYTFKYRFNTTANSDPSWVITNPTPGTNCAAVALQVYGLPVPDGTYPEVILAEHVTVVEGAGPGGVNVLDSFDGGAYDESAVLMNLPGTYNVLEGSASMDVKMTTAHGWSGDMMVLAYQSSFLTSNSDETYVRFISNGTDVTFSVHYNDWVGGTDTTPIYTASVANLMAGFATFELQWKVGTPTFSGGYLDDVAADGYIRLLINGVVVSQATGVRLYLSSGATADTNRINRFAPMRYGALGQSTNYSLMSYDSGGTSSSLDAQFNAAPIPGDAVVVIVSAAESDQDDLSVSDSFGNTYTLQASTFTDGPFIYLAKVVNSGRPFVVTVDTARVGGDVMRAVLMEVHNVDFQAASLVSDTNNTTSTSTTPYDNLVVGDDALLISAMTYDGSGLAVTPSALWAENYLLDEGNSTGAMLGVISKVEVPAGTYQPGWTLSSSVTWHVASIAIKAPAASSGNVWERPSVVPGYVGRYIDGGRAEVQTADNKARLVWYAIDAGLSSGTYYDMVVSDKPRFYWRFTALDTDDYVTQYGTLLDGSGNSLGTSQYRLMPMGGYTLPAASVLVGDGDASVLLNGSNAYLKTESNLPFPAGAFTIEAWIQTSTSVPGFAAVACNRNGVSGFFFGVYLGKALFHDDTWGSPGLEGVMSIDDGRPHHICVTYDDVTDTGRLYVDGQLEATGTRPSIGTYSTQLTIGLQDLTDPEYYFPGKIDEVAIYGRALARSEVSAHVSRGSYFMSDAVTIPAPGTKVTVRYWKNQQAKARVTSASSIQIERMRFGDDGIRQKILQPSDMNPVPRSSRECMLLGGAFLEDFTTKRFEGGYSFVSMEDHETEIRRWVRPGRPLHINVPALQDDEQRPNGVTVMIESVSSRFLGKGVYEFTLDFGPVREFENKQRALLLARKSLVEVPSLTDYQEIEADEFDEQIGMRPPDPISIDITSMNGPYITLKAEMPPASVFDGYEFRMYDAGWGGTGAYLAGLDGRSNVIPYVRDHKYYCRSYRLVDPGNPFGSKIYSANHAMIRVSYPIYAPNVYGVTGDLNATRCRLVMPSMRDRDFFAFVIRKDSWFGETLYYGDGIYAKYQAANVTAFFDGGQLILEIPNPSQFTSMTFAVSSVNTLGMGTSTPQIYTVTRDTPLLSSGPTIASTTPNTLTWVGQAHTWEITEYENSTPVNTFSVPGETQSWTFQADGRDRTYEVAPVDSFGGATPMTFDVPGDIGVPSAPTASLSYDSTPSTVTQETLGIVLSWTKPSTNYYGITVYEWEVADNGSFTVNANWQRNQLYPNNVSAATFSVPYPEQGVLRYFRVRAVNSFGNGAWSSTVSGTAPNVLDGLTEGAFDAADPILRGDAKLGGAAAYTVDNANDATGRALDGLASDGNLSLPVITGVKDSVSGLTATSDDIYDVVTGYLGASAGIRFVCLLAGVDYTSDAVVADGVAYFHIPLAMNGMNLVYAKAKCVTAGTTGTATVQVRNVTQAADMLSTKITFESGATTSGTVTAAVIDTANDDVATDDLLAIDIDTLSTTKQKGILVTLGFAL
jgi:hypothetical protein